MTAAADVVLRLGFATFLGGATFFAPCAFPLLPGYLAFYVGTGDGGDVGTARGRVRRGAVVGLVASAGFFLVFAALGGLVALLGNRAKQALSGIGTLELVVGVLLVGLGAAMATGSMPRVGVRLPERRRSLPGFFLFGLVYAVAAAGCTALLFVGVVVASFSAGPVLGAATLVAYAAGMSAVMVVVSALAALGRDELLRRLSGSTGRIERAAGVLLVLAGVTQVVYYLFWLGGWQALFG